MTRNLDFNSDFTCLHCGSYVSAAHALCGVNNRNHCPYCLWSRHLDWRTPGDRLSACKAPMQPVGLTLKRSRNKYAAREGELMLVHLCLDCGTLAINRIAADDHPQDILSVLAASPTLTARTPHLFRQNDITLLQPEQAALVERQLFGQVA
jgi:DNA-directed RNA polymerase subunit RPC12/RpoP